MTILRSSVQEDACAATDGARLAFDATDESEIREQPQTVLLVFTCRYNNQVVSQVQTIWSSQLNTKQHMPPPSIIRQKHRMRRKARVYSVNTWRKNYLTFFTAVNSQLASLLLFFFGCIVYKNESKAIILLCTVFQKRPQLCFWIFQ